MIDKTEGGSAVLRIVFEATGKQALTLDELAAFVQEAMRAGVPGDTIVTARVSGWAGRLRRVETGGNLPA